MVDDEVFADEEAADDFVLPRKKRDEEEMDITPMIDIVFLLLIFFMLTLKILAPEGDFNINMPIGQASAW